MKNNFIYYIVLTLFFCSPFLLGQQQVEVIRYGHTKWQVPCDVTQITAQAYGAGGGGGGARGSSNGGGGGSGSAVAQTDFIVITPGVLNVSIGGVGNGGNGNASGSAGGDTWFYDNTLNLAKGGRGGSPNNGAGGIAWTTGSIGDVTVNGDNGVTGNGSVGGAGGKNNGPAPFGGVGGAGATGNNDGGDGGNFGGGGGGAHRNNNNNNSRGGNGGEGAILVFYDRLYCANSFIGDVEPITNVTFAGVNNTTSNVINGSPQNEYFCALTANVTQGNSFPISLKGNTNGNYRNYFTVFIDWNQDGDYNDPGERYNIGYIQNSNGTDLITLNGNIAVPASAPLGVTKMRVVKNYGGYTASPCEVNQFGQTEEYNVEVQLAVSCDPITATASEYVICAGDPVTLTASSTTSGYTYTWYTDWDNDTHTGTLVGTGSSINVNPTESILYGVVATKTGCPTGVNAAYALLSIFVTPPPTLIVMDPIESITCSNESSEINLISGGIIPETILDDSFDPTPNYPWIISTSTWGGSGPDYARWGYTNYWRGITSPDNSNFMVVDSDAYGPYQMESSLITPPLSFLDYNNVLPATDISLTFDHVHWTDGLGSATVEVTTDGNNWTIIKQYTSDQGNPPGSLNFVNESIDLNAYKGASYFQIRFRYQAFWDWFWAIDNVKITGLNPLPTTVTWSPITGLWFDEARTIPYDGTHALKLYASPSTTTTYTISAKTSVGCPAETTVIVNRGDKDWISPSSTDWNIATNWNENSVPTADHCVRIHSMASSSWPIISSGTDGLAKNLTVDSGGGLTIKGGGSLTVTDHIVSSAPADSFVIETDGNLIQINDVTVVNSDAKIRAERYVSGIKNNIVTGMDYIYWSSPVAEPDQLLKGPSGFSPGTPIGSQYWAFLQYNESNDYFDNTLDTYFLTGKGYAIRAEDQGNNPDTGQPFTNPYDRTFKFRGKLNNGIINRTIVKDSNSSQGFNLVGNPYPSNIDADILFGLNSNIYASIYLWTNSVDYTPQQQGSSYSGNNYAIYNMSGGVSGTQSGNGEATPNPDGIVKIGQGFLVQKKDIGTGNLLFNNSVRVTESGHFYSKEPKDRYWLTLTSPENIINTALIGYIPGATNGYEQNYDGEFWGASDAIYSITSDRQLLIQGRQYPLDISDAVPLGYKAFNSGTHIISVIEKEGIFAESQNIYLIDKLLNKTVKISDKPYKFLTRAGEFNDRFVIVYRPGNIIGTAAEISNQILFAKVDNQIVITSTIDKIAEVELFNLNSRSVYKKSDVNSNELRIDALNFNHQIVVVTVKTETGEFVTRKFVNN